MSRNIFDDSRDEELARVLRDATPEPPMHEVDWAALHARITAAAQSSLQPAVQPSTGAQPRVSTVWQPLSAWSRRGIPLAAAASTLLVIGAAWLGLAEQAQPQQAGAEFVMVEEQLAGGAGFGAGSLFAGLDADEMIDVALFGDGEEW